ncbi:MAG: limonene-1,2-epoxide hydrolase [Gammaproteobacteria bacterium]|jgi:limonene-1,2-epoxide hydrolase|nr:limonene-1,2-epoxide hydrolase [Gammaproteobacteria bacterium]|tara:strand:+ start:3043 stop:3405 length:363 start_codon:yes stop_codon:yes gene_type:complete
MSNTQIVLDFIDGWNRLDWDAVIALLAEDVIYQNIPMEKVIGRDATAAVITGMQAESMDWEVLSIAENGNKVLTERVDNIGLPGGKKISLPVMGTFEIEDGLIKAWRDYFDLATFTSQMA